MEVERRSVLHNTADQYAEVFQSRSSWKSTFCPRLLQCMVYDTSLRNAFRLQIGFFGRLLCFLVFCCQGPWWYRFVEMTSNTKQAGKLPLLLKGLPWLG